MSRSLDVIVIGAGFAGLSAALGLQRAGLSFLLIEAGSRVGGKVESRRNTLHERLDAGGQFFCEDMPSVMDLVTRYRKTKIETPVAGNFSVQPKADPEEARRIYRSAGAMRARLHEIAPDDPAIAGLTVADWLEKQPELPETKAAFHSMVEGLWCLPITTIPLWYLIDNNRRITNGTFELQYFLRNSMHSLAEDMAAELGERLLLNAPVTQIRHAAGQAAAVTPKGEFTGGKIILALPPTMAARIAYSPALPEQLGRALAAWKSGSVAKTVLRYTRPFWRDRGLSGMVLWRDVHGLFACDASPDAEHATLVVWTAGPLADLWRSEGEPAMKKRLVERLCAALGPEAAEPLDILLRDWTSDAWVGGGYSDIITDMSARDAEKTLRGGIGALLFASSEISPSFPGYVEGAVVAGGIAARAAAEALSRRI
ncbi:MAG: flavin monoamine oxidase family protein [Rhizobiaceae bacterium]